MNVRTWLEERFSAVILGVPSDSAEELLRTTNGMNFVQLLRPFARCQKTMHVRTLKDYDTFVLKNFAVRVFDVAAVREVTTVQREAHFTRLLRASLAKDEQRLNGLRDVVDVVLSSPNPHQVTFDSAYGAHAMAAALTPAHWEDFVRDYVHSVRCSFFDTIDHPVAAVYSASSSEADPIASLRKLMSAPPATRKNAPGMDTLLYSYYILLHDVQKGPPADELARLQQAMNTTFGQQNCCIVRINSNASGARVVDITPWLVANRAVDCIVTDGSETQLPPVDAAKAAMSLTDDDVNELSACMTSFMSASLAPYLERRIRTVAQFVSEKKKSALGKVAAWFRSDNPSNQLDLVHMPGGGDPRYNHDSLEMQMRRCGDMCFMLHDYEAASHYYRMLRGELQSSLGERAFNKGLIAAAQEALGLCQLFQNRLMLPNKDGRKSEDNKLEVAVQAFRDHRVHNYAFRDCLILHAMCRQASAVDKSGAVMHRVLQSEEFKTNNFYTALCLEQTALAYLCPNAPHIPMFGETPKVPKNFTFHCMPRQFAMFMVLAGFRFAMCEQSEAALRAYNIALEVYRRAGGRHWHAVWDQVFSKMGILHHHVGSAEMAVGHTSAVLLHGECPTLLDPKRAVQFMGEYLSMLKAYMGPPRNLSVAPFIAIPLFCGATVPQTMQQAAEDEQTAKTTAAIMAPCEAEWARISAVARDITSAKSSPNLKLAPGDVPRKAPAPTCVQGEPFTLAIELRNPLAIALQVQDIHLLALFREGENPSEIVTGDVVDTVDFPARGRVIVRLSIVAESASPMEIVGVRWAINGIVGNNYFAATADAESDPPGVFPRAAKEPRVPGASDRNIVVSVLPPQPQLTAVVNPPIPSEMRDGQVHRAALVLRNASSVAVARTVIQLSPNCGHLIHMSPASATKLNATGTSYELKDEIPAFGSVEVPVAFRADRGPNADGALVHNCYFFHVGYNSARGHAGDGVGRSVRFLRRCVVHPSCTIRTATISPSVGGDLLHHTVQTLVTNATPKHQNSMVRICRVNVVGVGWSVSTMGRECLSEDGGMGCLLAAGQSLSVPLKADRCPGLQPTEFVCASPVDTGTPQYKISKFNECLGETVLGGDCAAAFLAGASKGPGKVGYTAPDQQRGGGLSLGFYKDRGKKYRNREDGSGSSLPEEDGPSRTMFPIAICVSWCLDDSDASAHGPVFGQVFSFVDPYTSSLPAPGRPLTWSVPRRDPNSGVLNESLLDTALQATQSTAPRSKAVLAVHADFAAEAKGFFGGGRALVVPLTLRIENHSGTDLTVTVAAQQRQMTSTHAPFFWYGRNKAILTVKRYQSAPVSLSAQVFAPGVYNFASVQLDASDDKGRKMDVVVHGVESWTCAVAHDPACPSPVSAAQPNSQRATPSTALRSAAANAKDESVTPVHLPKLEVVEADVPPLDGSSSGSSDTTTESSDEGEEEGVENIDIRSPTRSPRSQDTRSQDPSPRAQGPHSLPLMDGAEEEGEEQSGGEDRLDETTDMSMTQTETPLREASEAEVRVTTPPQPPLGGVPPVAADPVPHVPPPQTETERELGASEELPAPDTAEGHRDVPEADPAPPPPPQLPPPQVLSAPPPEVAMEHHFDPVGTMLSTTPSTRPSQALAEDGPEDTTAAPAEVPEAQPEDLQPGESETTT